MSKYELRTAVKPFLIARFTETYSRGCQSLNVSISAD